VDSILGETSMKVDKPFEVSCLRRKSNPIKKGKTLQCLFKNEGLARPVGMIQGRDAA
jgi:hypothetical protein